MTLTLVQQKLADNWTSGAKLDITSIPAITNGNMLTIEYFSGNIAATIASIVQSGVTWVKATAASGNTTRTSEVWYAINVTGAGTSIVININATPTGAAGQGANLQEWHDSSGSTAGWSYLAAASNVTSGSSTNPATPSVTPTAGREALIVAVARIGGTWSADPTGFTALTPLDSPASKGYAAYEIVPSTSGSYQATWGSSTGSWSASIATFIKAAGAVSLTAVTGVFALTGVAATLSKTTTGYVLTADVGAFSQGPPPSGPSFVLTGNPVSLRYSGARVGDGSLTFDTSYMQRRMRARRRR